MKKSTNGRIRTVPETLSDMLLKCLVRTTLELWRAVNANHEVPHLLALYEEMANPQPGDTVLEITTARRILAEGKVQRSTIGRLISQSGSTYVIDALSGKRQTWANAQFIKMIDRDTDASQMPYEEMMRKYGR